MNLPLNTLTSLASGPSGQLLYLNADNFGNVTVQYSQAPTSTWSFAYLPSSGSVMIISEASGQALAVDGTSVVTTTDLSPNGNNTWTFAGTGQDYAIRPQSNSDLNLNIKGDSYPAGTPVIVYKWDQAPNSKWNPKTV
jgi:hypothetical protein